MAEVTVFEIDAKDAIDKLAQLRADTNALKQAQKELAVEVEKGNKDAARSFEANAIILKNVANEQRVLSRAVEGYSQVQKNATDTTNFANNSIQENRDLLKQLTAQYINLKNPTKEQTEQIKKLSDELKVQEAAIGNTSRNVGNYEGALKSATSEVKIFGTSVGDITTQFNKVTGALKDARSQLKNYVTGQTAADGATKLSIFSTQGLAAAMRVLRLALIATGIGAIVVLLGSLAAALLTTQKGTDKLNESLTQIKVVFQALLGVAQELGEDLIKVFENPKQAINDLIEFLKGNLINRLTAFKVVLDGILERDTKKLTDGILQLTTGVTNLTDKAEQAAKNAANFLNEQLEKGKQIAALQREIEDIEINLNKERELAQKRENELFLIAKNTNLSLKERKKASDEILANTDRLSKIEEQAQIKRIEKLKLEQSLNDTDRDGKKELADLEAELIRIQEQSQKKRKELLEVFNQVQKAENALLKEKKEIIIDTDKIAVENQKKFIEEFLSGVEKELELLDLQQEQRREFLEQSGLSDLEITEKFRQERLDLIDEFNLQEKEKQQELQQELLDAQLENQQKILEGEQLLQDARIANAQLATSLLKGIIGEQTAIGKVLLIAEKASAIAEIIINTQREISGIAAFYAPLGPFGAAAAAAAITAAKVRAGLGIATIAAQSVKDVALPKKEQGGEIEVHGKSHSQGGEVVTVGGRLVAEVEGGEGLYVMKKNAYQQLKQFSAINQAFGGKSWLSGSSRHLADGGAINTTIPIIESRNNVNATIEQNKLLTDALRRIPPPVLSIKEFETKQSNKDRSVRIAEL